LSFASTSPKASKYGSAVFVFDVPSRKAHVLRSVERPVACDQYVSLINARCCSGGHSVLPGRRLAVDRMPPSNISVYARQLEHAWASRNHLSALRSLAWRWWCTSRQFPARRETGCV